MSAPTLRNHWVSPSTNRCDTISAQFYRGNRDFLDRAARCRQQRRVTAEAWNSISIMPNGIDAGITGEPALDKNFQCPETLLRDGVAWSAVSRGCDTTRILDGRHCPLSVLPELSWRHAVYQLMGITMTPDFVPARSDLLDGSRPMLGHPSQDEKRCGHPMFIEKVQNSVDLRLYTRRKRFPLSRVSVQLNFGRMEVFFNVNRQGIDHGVPRGAFRRHFRTITAA